MESSNAYIDVLNAIVRDLAGGDSIGDENINVSSNKVALVVITSDRGLAGAYNSNILKLAEKKYKVLLDNNKEIQLITIGKKSEWIF